MRAKTIGELIPTSVASAAPATSADERVKALEERMTKALAENAEKDAELAALRARTRNLDTAAHGDLNAVVLSHRPSESPPRSSGSAISRMWNSLILGCVSESQ